MFFPAAISNRRLVFTKFMITFKDCKLTFRRYRGLCIAVFSSLLVLAAFGRYAVPHAPSAEGLTLREAQRSNLVVSIKESGTFEPVKETTIRNEVRGSSRIVFLIKEGSIVEKGDLLVELDAAEHEKRVQSRLLAFKGREAALAAAESRLVIAKSDAESAVNKAKLAVDFARMDFEKFEELEKSQMLRETELDVMLAEESLRISRERYENSKMLSEEGFETEATVNRDKLAVTSDAARLEKARSGEEMQVNFDMIKRYEELNSELIESQKELMRTQREAKGSIVKAEARLKSAEASLDLAKLSLEEAEEQLAATKIYAPHAGMVVYGGSASRVTRESMIEEGAEVRNRQELLTIPDTSAMKIRIKVHETVASDVQAGQEALVRLDSAQDRVLRGRVSQVALFPDRQSWWSGNQARVYSAEVTITDPVDDLQPGASGEAQIITHYLEDVITVPIDAVTTIEGRHIVEVNGPGRGTEVRSVELGVFNGRRVHVLSGLEEGETLVVRDAN